MQVYTCIVSICRKVVKRVYLITLRQLIAKSLREESEDGANEKAALRFPITALSFASISIFPG